MKVATDNTVLFETPGPTFITALQHAKSRGFLFVSGLNARRCERFSQPTYANSELAMPFAPRRAIPGFLFSLAHVFLTRVAVAIAEATDTPHSFDAKTAEDQRSFL